MLINNQAGYTRTSISLLSSGSETFNVTWTASKEGPLSLAVKSVIIDYNSPEDYTITLNRFVEIESADSFTKSDGSWTALLAIFVLMSLCSYIIYTGMENESEEESDSKDEVNEDNDRREMALPKVDEEKEN